MHKSWVFFSTYTYLVLASTKIYVNCDILTNGYIVNCNKPVNIEYGGEVCAVSVKVEHWRAPRHVAVTVRQYFLGLRSK